MDGSTVTVQLRVYVGISVEVSLDGRRPDERIFPSSGPLVSLAFVFRNVAAGRHTIHVGDVVGHEETAEVVVP